MPLVDVNQLCLGCMNILPHPKAVCPICNWSRQSSQNNLSQLKQGITLTNQANGNQYLIGKAVGNGGFGIVYVAFDLTNNRKVAIKEYFPIQFVSRDHSGKTIVPINNNETNRNFLAKQKRRFYQEAEKMQLFHDSPNVVNVLDYFEANSTAYIVMEFIEGQTFEQVLKGPPDNPRPGNRLPLNTVLPNLKPIIDILERIHHTPYTDDNGMQHTGITHRDISPENIMYASNGTVKLLDFGAARVSDPGYPPTGIIKPGYAPLEQQLSVPGLDSAQGSWTDVYALAATIYRAITGQIPPNALIRSTSDSLIPPSAMGIQITPHEEQVLLKGLAVKYQDRYQSVSQFYNDLIMPPPPPPVNKHGDDTLTKILWVIAAVAVIVAFLMLNKVKAHEIQLANVQEQIQNNEEKLDKYRDFVADYGYASTSYYSDKAIVFVKRNAETKVSIYCDLLSEDKHASMNNIDGKNLIELSWETAFNKDNRANVIIKAGNAPGYSTIHFTNEVNNDSFDVLVVVQ